MSSGTTLYIKKLLGLINTLRLDRHTGVTLIKIVWNQGGIRNITKRTEIEEKL